MFPTDPTIMEPLTLPEEGQQYRLLEDLALELAFKAGALSQGIHPIIAQEIALLVRSMNCYYSNLIEGHNTHPKDIERALQEDFSKEPEKRELQLEAKAHIDVQALLDERPNEFLAPSQQTICRIHEEFFSRLPDELLKVPSADGKITKKVVAGAYRDGEVQVGAHLPPKASALPLFMQRFEQAYKQDNFSKSKNLINVGAAHHRFVWIHPFYDGNGRVARLLSHLWLLQLGIGSSLWSISRGLARKRAQYKKLLMEADQGRHSDYDGRGNLSLRALEDFCKFFLEQCIDQVTFIQGLLGIQSIRDRLYRYCEEEIQEKRLLKGSFPLLYHAFVVGEFERGEASSITHYGERQARTVLNTLINKGLLKSNSPKGRVRLAFAYDQVQRWFPQLYPENL